MSVILNLLYLGQVLLLIQRCVALRYDPAHVGYNLNENQDAILPKDYWGQWHNHTYQPSPENWRFPFYVLTIDRFVDGDPTNNDANGTQFEHHWMANQFRFGGDVAGLRSNLDYLEGMGIKGIYFTGSMMINMPWSPDGYGPLDFTLLDRHHGDIAEWRALTDDIHSRGMYLILDSTMATMGNLLGYAGSLLNSTVEFSFDEYDAVYKDSERRYHDFAIDNARDDTCQMPRIWEQNGFMLTSNISDQFHGCRVGEFDMYGDIKGTGAYPSYINQLSRFASVQDRLREWRPSVLEKINVMACMQIMMLDIDGFRMDKAVQTTLDSMASFSSYQRECARKVGKKNFIVVGEIVADPRLAAAYVGRGKQPDMELGHYSQAVTTNSTTNSSSFIRPFGSSALDAAAFHYDVYGSMTRFLGLDGPWGALGVDWVEMYNQFLITQDLVNANTGLFDPRHMFGTTNQDVFRWPALANGTQRQLLGLFVTTLELPGIPMVFFGEEQEYYVLENLAPDYVFGRTPMASSSAWQLHGCYGLGQELYVDMPYNSSSNGCHDDSVSLDHRDPSHPMRNTLKRMFELRNQYPVLNDGFNLTTLSTRVYDIQLPGSQGIPSPHGIWSVYRGRSPEVQDFSGIGHGNQPVWLLFQNENATVSYNFDCSSRNSSSATGVLLSPFPGGTTVKNLFYPYEEYTLSASVFEGSYEGTKGTQGCLSDLTLLPWDYKAFVPISEWEQPKPVITHVTPGHDARLLTAVGNDKTQSISIQIGFSVAMDCNAVANSLVINSTTQAGISAQLNKSSVACSNVSNQPSLHVGQVPTAWIFRASLDNVANGIHTYTVVNATSQNGTSRTNARDKFMFRIGASDNPMVFPRTANYTRGMVYKDSQTGILHVTQRAAGAEKVRYSTNWGSSFSAWETYTGSNITLKSQNWSGTKDQEWDGEHVILHYWSRMAGSSDHVQHGDLGRDDLPPRRWPHAWVEGIWNKWGYDAGVKNSLAQDSSGDWTFDLFTEWPTNITINVWGINPDGQPDKTAAYGDTDRDGVLDWLPPDSLAPNVINISTAPAQGYVGYKVIVNDGNFGYTLMPYGSAWIQGLLALLVCIVPLATAVAGVWAFTAAFYKVKFNKVGVKTQINGYLPFNFSRPTMASHFRLDTSSKTSTRVATPATYIGSATPSTSSVALEGVENTAVSGLVSGAVAAEIGAPGRRTVLIATMEYEIEDWSIKIKIGGLGVMASLMAKNLHHQNLIWVIPCVGDKEYPFDKAVIGDVIIVGIMSQEYHIDVYYYTTQNITFVLLDTPVFRKRTSVEPYPPRMDDLESGVYYSCWNQCIAEVYRTFKPDIYHINDYHGAAAPLYLLPTVIPCCLSLHNAEFQGMWPLRTDDQMAETCRIFNLEEHVVKKYVQFGDIFNLLNAGVRYLYIHQGGFGAVGVSKKYGERSRARYPIFWCLDKIGSLPNPDPTDTAPWNRNMKLPSAAVDSAQEQQRSILRCQAQEWAGLEVDSQAELFVFVGRWSQQKGVDLIADVFSSILEKHGNTQLICVGPVIDLYGRFAALKLAKLMEQYPGRVCSKPEFTALPSCIFSGAEFALMPSRDEPFGLVAVEFGRKGALCVGSRVGGFGHMPGWWFTVESVTTKHLISQFKAAISAALASDTKTRASMRAYSGLQRFPVAQWIEDLDTLQSTSISKSVKVAARPASIFRLSTMGHNNRSSTFSLRGASGVSTPRLGSRPSTPRIASTIISRQDTQVATNSGSSTPRVLSAAPSRRGSTAGLDSGTPDILRISDLLELEARAQAMEADNQYNGMEGSKRLSMSMVESAHSKSALTQNATPVFTDAKNKYYDRFSAKLDKLITKPSTNVYIEEYLVKSEKDWFNGYHDASMSTTQLQLGKDSGNPKGRPSLEYLELLGDSYQPPNRLKRFMQSKIGTWNVYSFFLALGQILCASSLQLTLLTGTVGQPAIKLYILCAVYATSSICWWILYRQIKAVYVLSAPFLFFGVAFLLLGIGITTSEEFSRGWIFNAATGVYAAGSSAGSFYFTLNFGTEGGAPPQSWAFRACVITGSQQLLIAFLWYFGATAASDGITASNAPSSVVLTAVAIPLAILIWSCGLLLYLGLPDYYRRNLGAVPSFYISVCRKGIVIWFWIMVILQGYWLSSTYGRNWTFLWSSQHAPKWAVALLVILFFVVVWAAALAVLGSLSKRHAWLIPIFAIGLGAPGWCQMLWGVSGISHHIPWAGAVGGALLSRSIWLWLGVLTALQDVGFGMILLMTLTRLHITFVFIAAQVIGAAVTVLARATAPNKIGAGDVYINVAGDSIAKVWFWLSLACQLIICVGYFKFFRKAQLSKP